MQTSYDVLEYVDSFSDNADACLENPFFFVGLILKLQKRQCPANFKIS